MWVEVIGEFGDIIAADAVNVLASEELQGLDQGIDERDGLGKRVQGSLLTCVEVNVR